MRVEDDGISGEDEEDEEIRDPWLAREFKLWNEVGEPIACFAADYSRPSIADQVWAARVHAQVLAQLDRLRQRSRERGTDMPSGEPSLLSTAEPRSTHGAVGTADDESRPANPDEKKQRWLDMWRRAAELIAEFEAEHVCASARDRDWSAGVATSMRAMVAKHRRDLQIEHPDMPAISEPAVGEPAAVGVRRRCRDPIAPVEALFSHLVDGVDPNDDELTADDEAALRRSGLTRAAFIAARGRLRVLIDDLPEATRANVIKLILNERRRRS